MPVCVCGGGRIRREVREDERVAENCECGQNNPSSGLSTRAHYLLNCQPIELNAKKNMERLDKV